MKVLQTRLEGGRWRVYRNPQEGFTYVIGLDAAKGVAGGNQSALCVLCVNDGRQDAVCRGQIDPTELGTEAEKGGLFFNQAEIAVEFEKHGQTVIEYLKNRQYPRLYFHTQKLASMDAQSSREYGWNPTYFRATAIDWMVTDLSLTASKKVEERRRALWLYDPETISQCGFFGRDKKTGKYKAVQGKMDDLVSATYIANYVRRERMGELFRAPLPPPKELTFLERMDQNTKVPDERDMGRRNAFS